MAAVLSQLVTGNFSTMIATGLGFAVCALTVFVIVFTGDPRPEA